VQQVSAHNHLVEITNVSKAFTSSPPYALENVSATIPKGEIVGLVGPDGAGKTTLLRLIAGLLKPTNGSITVAGLNTIQDAEKLHTIIGYMPQKFGLYEDLTVMQNLSLHADLRGVEKEEREKIFAKLLAFTDLQRFTDRLAGALSGGMKQKLGLACTLIKTPTLLLLDEPSVGVDPISRRELWKMVHALIEEGISVIWSTAYLDEAEKCKTVLLLNEGKLLFYGKSAEMTKRVEGRTFVIRNIQANRRMVLKNALNHPNILDGVIQGRDVRIVTRKEATPPLPCDLKSLHAGENAEIVPCAPRFEDAFVDALGGGPGGTSLLAENIPQITPQKNAVIEAHRLTKRFGSFTAANEISFSIQAGEIFGLLGPNGAGKSTTFKMLCGLLQPTSGNAEVNGYDLQKAPSEARESIGYMAQKFSLYGNLSVEQNLNFFSGAYNLFGQKRKTACEEMIRIFNLHTYLNESADMLPLGFKQRLALSCSVMHHPKVLFLDEPTSGVDPITRREFWNHINGLVGKGVTVMVTTHFMDEAEYCDRIGLVYQSKLITVGTPDELKLLAKTEKTPSPTLEDAFIYLIEQYDEKNGKK
jgi:ABC-2 type transport system ATP-binding protein